MIQCRSIRLCAACAVVVLFSSIRANDVNTGGQKGIIRTLSAHTLGQTGFNAGAAVRGAMENGYVRGPGGTDDVIENATGRAVDVEYPTTISGNVFLAYGLLNKWDIGVSMPLYYDVTGWGHTRSGVGDLEVATKLGYPFESRNAFFSHAYYLKAIFPTGQADRGYFPRHAYYTEDNSVDAGDHPFTASTVLFNPMLLWTLDFSRLNRNARLSIHANFGGVITPKKNSSAVVAAAGLEFTPADAITLFCEVSGESRVKFYTETFSVRSFDNDGVRITPGIRFNTPVGTYVSLAGDFAVADRRAPFRSTWNRNGYRYSTAATPALGAVLMVGWNGIFREPDSDDDDVIDREDKCPFVSEDPDGFQDKDGCPEPDNDNDGIADEKDKCPDEAARCDGCPVYDSDADGINDDKDVCPNEAEDKDGFEDADGCPETDNDKDGVPDAADACPDKMEDADKYEDTDGCPDPDNDGDGILDISDDCPERAGVAENNGCPKTKEIQRGRIVLGGVNFQSGKALLDPNSYAILDQVYATLVEWPEIELEIRGYTDSRGSYEANKVLSQRRAEAVTAYLIQKGIERRRLQAVGYGEDNPIADNNTAEGRAQNRRVEMHRTD